MKKQVGGEALLRAKRKSSVRDVQSFTEVTTRLLLHNLKDPLWHVTICFFSVYHTAASFSSTAGGEERQWPQFNRADHKCHPPAGIHRRTGCGGVDGADGLQRMAVLSPPQEEAAGALHDIVCIHTSRWARRKQLWPARLNWVIFKFRLRQAGLTLTCLRALTNSKLPYHIRKSTQRKDYSYSRIYKPSDFVFEWHRWQSSSQSDECFQL